MVTVVDLREDLKTNALCLSSIDTLEKPHIIMVMVSVYKLVLAALRMQLDQVRDDKLSSKQKSVR